MHPNEYSKLKEAELVNTEGASKITGLSVSTLNKMRGRGDGPPYFKISSKVLYDPAVCRTWRDACLRTSTSQAA